jgi:SPP1 family predicted phage head-tail adaptor
VTTTGQLRHYVTIQSQASGQDAAGQPNGAWGTHAIVWADIRHVSGLEAVKADAVTSVVKASIRIRARSGVTAAMRVVHGATTYQVLAVLPSADRKWTDLVCEVVA